MENVMKSAWGIAYEGVAKFGGKVKEYFAEALKIAWDLFKNGGKEVNYAEQVKGTLVGFELPKLEGSEKQVKWAEKIREAAVGHLRQEVIHEQYEEVSLLPNGKTRIQKRPIPTIVNAMMSQDGIKAIFSEMETKSLPESRFESTVETMNSAFDRYARYTEIMSNTSAKFWIDNRDNQEKNYMFKAFKNYVTNDVKNY